MLLASAEKLEAILQRQMPDAEKRERTQHLIDTVIAGDLQACIGKLVVLYRSFCQLLQTLHS